MKRGSKEHGQIMILLALAIIVLLGFTALAVDMGMAYADRRQAQNAADAAALAGAQEAGSWIKGNGGSCGGFGTTQKGAAQSAATAAASKFYLSVSLTVDVSDCQNGQVGVTVSLSHTVRGAVFQRDTTNTVQAAAGVKSGGIADGFGLVALGDNLCGSGINMDGGPKVNITVINAGVFSNSGISMNGKGEIHAEGLGAQILYHQEGCYQPGNGKTDPTAQRTEMRMDDNLDLDSLLGGACGELGSGKTRNVGGVIHYSPGNYPGGISIAGNDQVVFDAGLFCVDNGVSFKGSSGITSSGGVTVFMKSGGFDVGGSGNKANKVDLRAPTEQEAENNPKAGISGLLIYYAKGNSSLLKFHGGSDSVFTGTIYAPEAEIQLAGGTGENVINAQFIGKQIRLNGNDTLRVKYDDSKFYKGAATLDLLR